MAADKYLVHHFSEALIEYVKNNLNAESSCLIYDQLIKIGEREELSLADVRTMIIEISKATLESDHFKQIDQETLIGLLSLDELSVTEDDLLVAVAKWVDCEVQRQGLPVNDENRRKVFEPIKPYILFSALKLEKIGSCKEITKLLTLEEIGSLLLHLLNKENPWTIELKSSRKAGHCYIVFGNDSFNPSGYYRSRVVRLSVNQRVRILSIYLTYSEMASDVSLQILDSNGVDLGLEINRSVKNGRLCFSLNPPLNAQRNCSYTLKVTGDGKLAGEDQLSKEETLKFKETAFNLNYSNGPLSYHYHCVRGLEFSTSV